MVSGDRETSEDDPLRLRRKNRWQNLVIVVGKGSMHKISLICSLLMAFGLSALMVGCENPKPPAETKTLKKADKGAGSTTGGGTEVPAAKGKAETPKAADKPAAEAPKKDEAAKTEEAPAKTEEAPAKTEEAPK
jgi:hypothetical protein